MKLKEELNEAIKRYSTIDKEKAKETIKTVYLSKEYNNLKSRIYWLFFNSFYTGEEVVELHEKYKCNDTHIETLAKNAFNSLGIDIDETIK